MKIWEFIILLIGIFIAGSAFAQSFTTSTGQGYMSWNGQVISYYSFNPGTTIKLVNGITATDTNSMPNETINGQAFNSYICNQQGTSC